MVLAIVQIVIFTDWSPHNRKIFRIISNYSNSATLFLGALSGTWSNKCASIFNNISSSHVINFIKSSKQMLRPYGKRHTLQLFICSLFLSNQELLVGKVNIIHRHALVDHHV
jgi:hypothetical protein